MSHVQSPRSKCLRCDFTFIKRRPLILLHEVCDSGRNALLSLVPLILILLLASPANSQLAPEASAVATANDSSSVVVSDHADIEKEPDKAQPGALESEETLRRELAAARAELAKQAEALEAQQRRDDALAHSLETAHRVIENLKTTASLWDSTKGAVPEAQTSMEASQASVKQVLDNERRKVEVLQQELTTARQTIDALKTGANQEAAQASAKQALDDERQKVESLEQELTTARQTIDALKAGANQEAAQASAKQALDDERRKVEILRQELTTARQTIDALKTGANQEAAQASAKQALDDERRKVEVLQQELTTARQTIDALKTGANQEAAQASAKQALERRKVESLEQELTTARQTIDALQKSANLAAGEQAKAVKDRQVAEAASKQAGETLALERERADSAERDLDIVRRDRDALKQSSMELSAALAQERERATGLARSLSAARKSIVKDKRRAAAERTLKARTPASAIALSDSGVQPARKPRSQKKQKAKYRKSPQLEVLAIELPAPLLPTRPLN